MRNEVTISEPAPARGVAIRDSRGFCGNARRRHQLQADQFGSGLRRHDPREIARIGEEEEGALNSNWHALLELNVVSHPHINLVEQRFEGLKPWRNPGFFWPVGLSRECFPQELHRS